MQKTIPIEQPESADTLGVAASRLQPVPAAPPRALARPSVRGKFLYSGDRKLYPAGVTYGPFAPDEDGVPYRREQVRRDFAAMAAHGIDSLRTYDTPPRWLLDAAHEHGLLVMAGVAWQQHVAFLDDRGARREIERAVRAGVAACAEHPALLCHAIGNEIPAQVVRWHGRRRVERFLQRLYRAAKQEDPGGLVTYVNYPSTEYLQLDFLDLACFNVYLERRERLEAYLARLQNVVGERPLLMTEIGLDSARNGLERQAQALSWQVEAAFQAGCAGAFVFSWTDEWHRGGHEIEDWDFGLTTRERAPKPALAAVSRSLARLPLAPPPDPPSFSVIVCTYNGERTLQECLRGIAALEYPDYETIVVSDGSTDATAQIAQRHDVRFVQTENRGLSVARNLGLALANGELVAYLDDDATPDPHWLTYLAHRFRRTSDVGVGGPNLPLPEDGAVAQAVANAPGGPTHVLVDDRHAEHIPGCNMAFRREQLLELGGFDPRFRVAGDDVDLCWRVLERGWTLGFDPGAAVWHHRRDTVRGYLRQQRGYGRAEALLERKWPQKYGPAGHVAWKGRMYGNGAAQHHGGGRWRVYYGAWGSGLFQSIYRPAAGGLLRVLPLMPEWYLVIALLSVVAAAGAFWTPLLFALPLPLAAVGVLLFDAALGGWRAALPPSAQARAGPAARMRLLTATLYLMQPLARLWGRFAGGLTPWRRRSRARRAAPWPRERTLWSERWRASEQRVRELQERLREGGSVVLSGGDWDRWDLEVRAGALGAQRLRMAVEEHGSGRQLVRVRRWPRVSAVAAALLACVGTIALAAALQAPTALAAAAVGIEALIAARTIYECAGAGGAIAAALNEPDPGEHASEDDPSESHPSELDPSKSDPVEPDPVGLDARAAAAEQR
jgi:GT2 family glycosyltransferase